MMVADLPVFGFDNSFAETLEGFYVPCAPAPTSNPTLVALNRPLAAHLGLDADQLSSPAGLAVLSGNAVPVEAKALAQAYAGHQFGGFSPQLGDGRALLLGEVIDADGQRRDIQLKGSGRTPFSRGGDGRATLVSVLREYLIAEAMFALGVPTTRALSAVATGDPVMREQPEPGAVLARVAASHLRVGTFEFFSARGEKDMVARLVDYALQRHFPDVDPEGNPARALLRGVAERQAQTIASWMGLGFIHGVMNTDNMTISGETIDYGPCAFMERYDTKTVFSSIDHRGRYAYGNQPVIGRWNLTRFAESLLEVLDDDAEQAVALAHQTLPHYDEAFNAALLDTMGQKLGLSDAAEADAPLFEELLVMFAEAQVDFTQGFVALGQAAAEYQQPAADLFAPVSARFETWLQTWEKRRKDQAAVVERMAATNPQVIPRNHKVEEALSAAREGDLQPFETLRRVLATPFAVPDVDESFLSPSPLDAPPHKTFCGT